MSEDLKSLMTSLSSGEDSSDETALQSTFSNLLSALGQSGSNTSLTSFLDKLSSKVQSNGFAGNLVNITA